MKRSLFISVILILTTFILGGCGIGEKLNEVENLQFKMFEGTIDGSYVDSAQITLGSEDLSIYVQTNNNPKGFYLQTKGCYVVKNSEPIPNDTCEYVTWVQTGNRSLSEYYIDSSDSFEVTQYKDKKNKVRFILMKQK